MLSCPVRGGSSGVESAAPPGWHSKFLDQSLSPPVSSHPLPGSQL